MKKILGILGTITIAGSGMTGLIGNASAPAKKEINYLQTSNLEKSNRSKRSIKNLPNDAHKIIIHNMRHFDVYGSNNGAYKVIHKSNDAKKIFGIDGNVISGIIADKYFQQKYNIYFTVKDDNCILQYYALKDGEATAYKINGLPNDAKLLAIHNLAGVIFFGSSNGAYELIQGQLNASKISHINGNVVKIKLNGSSRKYDADFITIEDTFNKCKYDLEFKKFESKINKYKNQMTENQEQINMLRQFLINLQNKFEIEKNQIKLEELEKVIIKYNSLDPDRFLSNIERTIKNIKEELNI